MPSAKQIFYFFLDTSGSMLGVFLIGLGWHLKEQKPVSEVLGWVVVACGISGVIVHGTHYVMSRKNGSEYFITTRKNR